MKRALLVAAFALLAPLCAFGQSLQGTYKLISFQGMVDGQAPKDYFGLAPRGFIVLTPTRFMSIVTSAHRKFGRTTEDKSALLDTIIAYTGPYRIEGDRFIVSVDESWNEGWTGTQQGRTFKVEGNRLTFDTDPAPYVGDATKMIVARLVLEKVE